MIILIALFLLALAYPLFWLPLFAYLLYEVYSFYTDKSWGQDKDFNIHAEVFRLYDPDVPAATFINLNYDIARTYGLVFTNKEEFSPAGRSMTFVVKIPRPTTVGYNYCIVSLSERTRRQTYLTVVDKKLYDAYSFTLTGFHKEIYNTKPARDIREPYIVKTNEEITEADFDFPSKPTLPCEITIESEVLRLFTLNDTSIAVVDITYEEAQAQAQAAAIEYSDVNVRGTAIEFVIRVGSEQTPVKAGMRCDSQNLTLLWFISTMPEQTYYSSDTANVYDHDDDDDYERENDNYSDMNLPMLGYVSGHESLDTDYYLSIDGEYEYTDTLTSYLMLADLNVAIVAVVKNLDFAHINQNLMQVREHDMYHRTERFNGSIVRFNFKGDADRSEIDVFLAFDLPPNDGFLSMAETIELERFKAEKFVNISLDLMRELAEYFTEGIDYATQQTYFFNMYREGDGYYLINNSSTKAYLINENGLRQDFIPSFLD